MSPRDFPVLLELEWQDLEGWPSWPAILAEIGPEGEVFSHTARLDEDQAQLMRAYGKRPPDTGWTEGAYRGYVRLIRGRTILAVRHADVMVK